MLTLRHFKSCKNRHLKKNEQMNTAYKR